MTEQNLPARDKELELKKEVAPIVAQAQALIVRCADDFRSAAEYRKANKATQKKVREFFDPICEAANQAWKKTTQARATFLDPLVKGDAIVRQKMESWQDEQGRLAEIERQRLQAEQDEKARKEREKLEAQAARAAEKGNAERADALRERAESVQATVVHVEAETPKVEGITTRKVWEATVTDACAFLAFVAQDQTGMFLGTVEISIPALNRMAKGDVAPNVPGVTYRRKIISASGVAR